MACLLLLVVLLALLMLTGLRGCACLAMLVLLEMRGTLIFECTALASLRSRYADLFTNSTNTMRSFFAQPDRMGVFHYVIDCLDFMKI